MADSMVVVRQLKSVGTENGQLFVVTSNYSGLLADCKVEIVVTEFSTNPIPAYPDCQVIKEQVCINICSDKRFYRRIDDEFFATVKRFSIEADVPIRNGTFEHIVFDCIEPEEIRPDKDWKFRVKDKKLVDKIISY